MKLIDVLRLIIADGGITFSTRHKHIKQTGFAVSPYKGLETKHKVLRVRHLVAFINKHRAILERPNHYLGAWFNQDDQTYYLDVSVVLADKSKAAALAVLSDQIAYYCLSTHTEHRTQSEVTA